MLTLAVTLLGARRAEMRASHRTYLNPLLGDLSEGVHSCLACTKVLRNRAIKQQERAGWITRGDEAAAKLSAVRPKLRYVLFGLEEPLRTIGRGPNWIATYRDLPDTNAEDLLDRLVELGALVDDVVRRSYRRGLPPSAWERWRLQRKTEKIRNLWEARFDGLEKVSSAAQPRGAGREGRAPLS